jgi:predicted RNase H-like nuclease (RuvC/YqgF family)
MSSEDEVNRFMVHGVAKTDFFVWENTHKVITEQLRGRIRFLEAQYMQLRQANEQLQIYNLQLQHANVNLQHKTLQLEEDNEGVKKEYTKSCDHNLELHNDLIKLNENYRISQNDNQRLRDDYEDINKILEKYETAGTEMYDLLEDILVESFSRTINSRIHHTLDEVDKLVTPVYRGNTQENTNKL